MLTQGSEHMTPLHQWAVGRKFFTMIVAVISIFFVQLLWAQIIIAVLILALYRAFGISFLFAGLRALRPLLFFVIFIVLWNIFQGQLAFGVSTSLRLINSFAVANLFTMTTRLDDTMALLQKLFAPLSRLGLNPQLMALTLGLSLRFIPILRQKTENLQQSWRARSSKRQNWRIVTPITLLALDDASQIADALRARGGVSNSEVKSDKRT